RFHDEPSRAFRLLRLQPHVAAPLAARAPLHAQRFERAHAPLVACPARLDSRADPHLLLRQRAVELGPLLRLGVERGGLPLDVSTPDCCSHAPATSRSRCSRSSSRNAASLCSVATRWLAAW